MDCSIMWVHEIKFTLLLGYHDYKKLQKGNIIYTPPSCPWCRIIMGGHSLLYFEYSCTQDLFIKGLFTLKKYYKIWYFQNKGKVMYFNTPYQKLCFFGGIVLKYPILLILQFFSLIPQVTNFFYFPLPFFHFFGAQMLPILFQDHTAFCFLHPLFLGFCKHHHFS